MRRLVAFGCSHTYGEGLSDSISHPGHAGPPSKFAWPNILAGELNLTCSNNGQGGISNRQISYNVLNAQLKTDDLVVILWTSIERSCFFTDNGIQLLHPGYARPEYIEKIKSDFYKQRNKFNAKYYKEFYWYKNLLHESLQCIDHTKKYLESKKIKNYHFNFNRAFGDQPINSMWPQNLPNWFSVSGHTIEMIDDYASDGFHPGNKAQESMAKQIFDIINY